MNGPPPPAPGAGDERVPEAFRPWLQAWLPPDADLDADAVLEAGLRALAAALRPEGRERQGAFDLLAADALITRACARAAAAPDPESALEDVLARVARP